MNKHIQSASRLYLDTNAIIYYVERLDELQRKIGEVVDYAVNSDKHIYVSEIGVAECLYGAYKMNDINLEERYNDLFYEAVLFMLVPVEGERLKDAARIGASQGLKLIDAIHLLAAIEMECDIFITNDGRFRSSHGLQVMQISEL